MHRPNLGFFTNFQIGTSRVLLEIDQNLEILKIEKIQFFTVSIAFVALELVAPAQIEEKLIFCLT